MSVCGVYIRMPRLLWESQRLIRVGLRGLVNRKGGVKRYYTYILTRLGIP